MRSVGGRGRSNRFILNVNYCLLMSTINLEKIPKKDKPISTRVTFSEYVTLHKIALKYNVRLSELVRKTLLRLIEVESR